MPVACENTAIPTRQHDKPLVAPLMDAAAKVAFTDDGKRHPAPSCRHSTCCRPR